MNYLWKRMDPRVAGTVGAIILMAFYFLTLTLANSAAYAWTQFIERWFWFAPLVLGFGIQMGLFSYIKRSVEMEIPGVRSSVAASSGVSTGAMVACCLHHVVELLPLIGLSAAALFLTEYQIPLIILGIATNAIGIMLMLVIIQEHALFREDGFMQSLLRFNMKRIRHVIVFVGIGMTILSFLYT